jgi:hypothetical protein
MQGAHDIIANIPPWVFTIGGVLIGWIGKWVYDLLIYKWRDRVAAGNEFRKAFVPLLSELGGEKGKLLSIMQPKIEAAKKGHEEAITAFSHHLTGRKKRAFERDCEKYRECRERCLASGVALIAAGFRQYLDGIGAPEFPALEGLKQSIEKLIEHAR